MMYFAGFRTLSDRGKLYKQFSNKPLLQAFKWQT